MKRFPKLINIVLALCMVCSSISFAFTDEVKAEKKPESEESAETTEAESEEKEDEEAASEEEDEAESKAESKTESEEEVSENEAKEEADWNVLIYLCGTDLESEGGMATTNLEMISKTVPDKGVNVLIETGGTKEWLAEERVGIDIANDRLQRWSYDEEGFKVVDEQENASMADHNTLSDFIRWSDENYPAKKHVLIVWDHGCGSARGLLMDELHDQALMSLEGLERGLKDGGVHFDLFMTDTCLMASLETAQAVKDYADYLLASEEVLPGYGSNYEEWLQDLYNEPSCGPVRLGKNICNATQLMYAEAGDSAPLKGLTFSVIDLKKIDAVAEAYNEYMKEVVSLIDDPVAFGQYMNAVSGADKYMEPEMRDIYDLARRSLKGGISKETVLKLENAVDDSVLACIRGSYHPYSHGLSVFYGYNVDSVKLDRLLRTCRNPWQLAFLDAVSLKWDAPEWACKEVGGTIPQLKPELYTVKFDTGITEDQSQNILSIHSGIDSGGDIRYELQRYDESTDTWYTLGESEDVNYIGNEDEDLTFSAEFTGKWPSIEDQFLHVTTKDVQANTVLMQASVFVPFMDPARPKQLRILAEYPENMDYAEAESDQEEEPSSKDDDPEEAHHEHVVNYQLEGLWDGYDSSTGLVDRNTYSMTDLEGVDIFVCKALYSDLYDKIGDMKFYEPIVASPWLEVEDAVLPAGKYRIRYTIKDMLDRTYNSEFAELTWDGQKAVFDLPVEGEYE